MSIQIEEYPLFNTENEKTSVLSMLDSVVDCKKQYDDGKEESRKKQSEYNSIPSLKDQMETSLKVLQLIEESKLTLTQINGQRRLGPPPEWAGTPPSSGCEIFVGKIPKTLYEHDIYPVFSTVGKIYEIRLMMDFSGMNRGYCFVMYTKPEEAIRAAKELDQYEICPGRKIGVVISINNCRLYVNHLPSDIDTEVVIKRIYEATDDVDKVAIYRGANGDAKYAVISYKTHRGAAMARRRLVPETIMLFNSPEVTIQWAYPDMSPFNVVRIRLLD